MAPTRFLTVMLLVAGALLLPAAGVLAVCITADCHVTLGKASVVHQPVADGDCTACHRFTGKPHPGAGSVVLVAKGRELCLGCHEESNKGGQGYAPVHANMSHPYGLATVNPKVAKVPAELLGEGPGRGEPGARREPALHDGAADAAVERGPAGGRGRLGPGQARQLDAGGALHGSSVMVWSGTREWP